MDTTGVAMRLSGGTIDSSSGAISFSDEHLTTTGVITGGTVEATADTSADDNSAMGYTSAEGVILTGQGTTSDVTIKNDADGTVIAIPTGTTEVGIGTTIANGDMTQGLTINQGGSDDGILAFKSSDVAHGVTGEMETDTYALFEKVGSSGGLRILGIRGGSSADAMIIAGGGTVNTTKGTGARAGIQLGASMIDGTALITPSAGGNLVTIGAGDSVGAITQRFIFDVEGDLHLDAGGGAGSADPTAAHSEAIVGYNVYDDHPDWQVARAIHASLVPETDFGRQHQELVERFRPILETRGIVTYNDNGHHFIATKKLALFQLDGLYQIGEAVIAMAKTLRDAGMTLPENVDKLLGLEGA